MLECRHCGARPAGPAEASRDPWLCRCGARLSVEHEPVFPAGRAGGAARGLARWADAMPLAPGKGLEAGDTPLFEEGEGILAKAEYRNPTGSFKDRGAALVVAAARAAGARRVAADSSGNAALALAAAATREGIACEIFVPETCPPRVLRRLAEHGADVRRVAGPRSAVAEACRERLARGNSWDAGHARNPWFLWGTRTFAWEVWDGLGGTVPPALYAPTGNGTLLLGAWLGFLDLRRAGLARTAPALYAVQVGGCAPLADSWASDRGPEPAPGPAGREARGLMVDRPPLAAEVLDAVRESGGAVLTVAEAEIVRAREELGRRGHPPDPCSAVAWAAARRADRRPGPVVVALTGSG